MAPAPEVTLYGREGCHLCDEAREGLRELQASGFEFEIVEVDIESDQDLFRRNLERIPVIEVQGREACELGFDRGAVTAMLASL